MNFLKYIKEYSFMIKSGYRSPREMLSTIHSLERQVEQPIHLTVLKEGEKIKDVKLGTWNVNQDSLDIRIEVGE